MNELSDTQKEYVDRFTPQELVWVCSDRLEGHAVALRDLAYAFELTGNQEVATMLLGTSLSIATECSLLTEVAWKMVQESVVNDALATHKKGD